MDRLLAQLSGRESPAPVPASTSGPRRAITRVSSSRPTVSRAQRFGLWARVALGLTLAVLITQWPYAGGGGWPLAGYLGAVAMVLLTGVWIAIISWELRSVAAHVLAFLMLLWGVALVAERVLPRVGYATQRANWSCVEGTTVEALPYGLIGSIGLRDPLASLLLLVG